MRTKINLRILVYCCFASFFIPAFAQKPASQTLHFPVDAFSLSNSQKAQISAFLKDLGEFDRLEIVGHTDSTASTRYNQRLSEKRARAVQDLCIAQGIPPEKLQMSWKGELEPDPSSRDLAANRRVTLTAIYPSQDRENDWESDLLTNANNGSGKRDLSWLFNQIQSGWQEFIVNPYDDASFTTAGGMKFYIPAGSLPTDKRAEVKLVLREFLTLGDMLSNRMTTTADDKLLQTAGSFQLLAIQGTDTLSMALRKPIKVAIPSDTLIPGMASFQGEWQTPSHINWTPVQGQSPKWGKPGYGDSRNPINRRSLLRPNIFQRIFWTHDREIKYAVGLSKTDTFPKLSEDVIDGMRTNLKPRSQRDYLAREYLYALYGRPKPDTIINPMASYYELKGKVMYELNFNRLGFINCDKYMDRNTDIFTLNLDSNEGKDDISFMVLPSERGILPSYTPWGGDRTMFSNIPSGFKAIVVRIQSKDNQFYFGTRELVLNSKVSIISVPTKEMKWEKISQELAAMTF